MLFTDHYAHPTCTAGRAAFITGQYPVRTGMTTIGIPGSSLGLQKEDPTLAEVLKPLRYTSGQFGKNHLGDRYEFLPTAHGFDEFYGNLYHLNAEEESVTLAAAAGETNLKDELLQGRRIGDMTYKVHLDGHNNLDLWSGKTDKSTRNQYFYYDASDLTGVRAGDWKMSFAIKEKGLWWDPMVYPRVPYLFNLRMDPMERFDPHSPEWGYMARKLFAEKLWTLIPAQGVIAEHIQSLQGWPPRQRADSLSMQKAMTVAHAESRILPVQASGRSLRDAI